MDYRKIVQEELKTAFKTVNEICKKNNIPYFLALPIKDDGKTTEYHLAFLSPMVAEVELTDDKITKMLNVMNGFETIPPTPIPEFML